MRAVSLLVLLGCSLLEGQSVSVNDITRSHYGGRENQIQAENPRTESSDTTSTQQSCQPDIYSVLREMSVMLAELKVEQRHTTTAVDNMESRLRASESQMEELKKKNEERKVAFSVSLSGGEEGHTGPYSAAVTLVYKHVFTNIGNAYNPATGIFTAPVRGVYQFRFHIYGAGTNSVGVVLHKNGHHETGAYANPNPYLLNASNGVSLLLEVGDVICIKLHPNSWIFDNWFHHSTFSGQMLFSV